jgi:hypothetical protein
MAQGDNVLPYGLRDTRITPYTTAALTTLGTGQDDPNARSMSFSEAEDFEELRGDDKVVAIVGKGAGVEWEMEHGGISLAAYKLMSGGTLVVSGVTPNSVATYTRKSTDIKPYFKAEGQSISDTGGDFHVNLLRCRASDKLEGELADGSFWLTGAGGIALPALLTGKVDVLYEFISNETATAPV